MKVTKRWSHPAARAAVQQLEQGVSIAELARGLEVNPNALDR
jgi:transposase-like protein